MSPSQVTRHALSQRFLIVRGFGVVEDRRDAKLNTSAVTVAAIEDLTVIQDDRLPLSILPDVFGECAEVIAIEEREYVCKGVKLICHSISPCVLCSVYLAQEWY